MKICCLALGILCDPSLPQLSHLLNGSNHPSCAHLRQFMRRPSRIVKETVLCHVQLFVTPQTVAHQPPLSMGFSSQEYWSESPFSSPGDLADPGIEPVSLNISCIGMQVLYHEHHLGSHTVCYTKVILAVF